MMESLCSKCGQNLENINASYCNKCKASYMREWRKTHFINEEERKKSIVRRKLNMKVLRGKIKRQPCITCGHIDVEAHHPDYDKPYDVIWYCRKHHLEHHKMLKKHG